MNPLKVDVPSLHVGVHQLHAHRVAHIDALKTVAHGVNSLRGPELGILLITHYQRLLNYIIPDYVHVMVAGRIVRSGSKELALELEERGYDWAREEASEAVLG